MSAISRRRWLRASPHLDRLLDLTPTERESVPGGPASPKIRESAADVRALLDRAPPVDGRRLSGLAARDPAVPEPRWPA